jgi:DNA polymerase III epsilon subunit-like protein
MELIIDTETTGLTSLSFVTERNYRQWPRLVQIAWGVVSEDKVHLRRTEIIHPEGFNIPEDSVKVHGITQKHALDYGKDLGEVLNDLNEIMKSAHTLIAHNLNFDIGVLQSESIRMRISLEFPEKRQCTAFMGQKYMRKEKKLRLSEFPRLSSLYKTLFNREHKVQHKAHSDMIACGEVYLELKKHGYTN